MICRLLPSRAMAREPRAAPRGVRPSAPARAGTCVGNRRGSAAVEFGLLLPLYLAAAIGVVEIGWQLTIASALDRGTLRASRFGMTGQPTAPGAPAAVGCRSQGIPWMITRASADILRPERLTVTLGAFSSPSRMGDPPVAGPGAGGQVVTYTVTYRQPFLTGAWVNLVGGPTEIVHRSTIIVRNEAFANATC